jgi:para-nitrobenzyl esterase
MDTSRRHLLLGIAALTLSACAHTGSSPDKNANPLENTRWQLIDIQSMDDTTVKPDDSRRYTLAFDAEGRVSIQADCNRMGGSYTFTPPSGLVFGLMHSTLAACPPGSLYDRVGKDMPYVRSFILKEGHLYLSLMADGGIYHFSPLP